MIDSVADKAKNIDELLVQTIVLLQRQQMLIDRHVTTQSVALGNFEKSISGTTQSVVEVLDVYNYVFGLIDHLVRYQKIASYIPKFNQKKEEYKAFEVALKGLKDIRNQFQHINNHIDNKFSGPLLGSISWFNCNASFTAALPDINRVKTMPGLIFDIQENKFIHDFCYIYNESYYDLGKAICGVRSFSKFIETWVSIEIDGKPYAAESNFMAYSVAIKLK